jgi:hypothetical protein
MENSKTSKKTVNVLYFININLLYIQHYIWILSSKKLNLEFTAEFFKIKILMDLYSFSEIEKNTER